MRKEGSVRSRTIARIVAVIVLAGTAALAPAQEGNLTVLVKGNLTTRTSLFLNPNSPDPMKRAEALDLTDFFGSGVEIRYLIPRTNLAVSLSADYLRFQESNPITVSFRPRV